MLVEDPGTEALAELLLIDSDAPFLAAFLAFSFWAFFSLLIFCSCILELGFFGLVL